MTPVEIALIILVSIWSFIFVIVAVGLIIILYQVKKAIDKVNKIIQTAENVTEGVGTPLKMAAEGIRSWLNKKGSTHKSK